VVEGDGASAEKDQGKCEGSQGQGKFVSAVAHESVVEVNFDDGNQQINADGKSRHTSEQAKKDEQASKELSKGGKIRGPAGQSEAGDEIRVMVKSAENLMVSMAHDDGPKSEAHDEKREGLQAVEVAQVIPPAARKIAYSRGTEVGKQCLYSVVVQFGVRVGPVKWEILRYA
jgi:hypothetical protein